MIILNESKPKYEKLDELLDTTLTNIKFSNQITMIIDLKEILKKLFRPDINVRNYNITQLCEEISADVLGTIAHYRNYFYKKGKYTNFYILDSLKRSEVLDAFYEGYRKDFYEKYVLKEKVSNPNNVSDDIYKQLVISKVCKAISIAAKLIPHVYTIDSSDYGDVTYSKSIIQNINKNELIFILSNDALLFQLIDSNVFVITPKGIKSELVTNENIYKILSKKDDINIDPSFFPLLLSFGGYKKYSIKNIEGVGYSKAATIIKNLVDKNKLNSGISTISFPIEFSVLDSNDKVENIIIKNNEKLIKNYNLIKGDIFLSQHKLVIQNKIFMDYGRQYSIHELKKLNDVVFKNYPLHLDMLLKGEQI